MGCGPGDEVLFSRIDGIVRGTILDGGDPSTAVGQARVTLFGVRNASSFTDQDGTFEIRSVPVGLYDLVAVGDVEGTERRVRLRFVEVVRGQVLDLPDLDLEDAGSVSGTVLLTGASAGNPAAPDNAGVIVELVGTELNTVSAADGSYSLPVVEQGDYVIRFQRDQFISESLHNVAVASGADTAVTTVTLQRLDPPRQGLLRGRVVLEAQPDQDFSGVRVVVDGTTRSLTTTVSGEWSFGALPVGTYDVSFSHPDYFDARQEDLQVIAGVPVTHAPQLTLSNHQVLDEGVTASGLAVSPSGNQLAFLTDNLNASEIGLLNPQGGTVFRQIITSGARAAANRGLEWSPDEDEIVYIRFNGGSVNAFQPVAVTDTGSAPRALLATGTDYFMGTFSPDREEMLFFLTQNLVAAEVEDDSTDRLVVATATTRTVAAGLGVITELNGTEWGNTGRVVYDFQVGTTADDDIFTVLASGSFPPVRLGPVRRPGPGTPAAPLVGPLNSPTFSPDFSRLAFSLEVGGADPAGIYICDVDGTNAMQISSEPGRFLDWAPDGRHIYYVADDTRHPTSLKVPSSLR